MQYFLLLIGTITLIKILGSFNSNTCDCPSSCGHIHTHSYTYKSVWFLLKLHACFTYIDIWGYAPMKTTLFNSQIIYIRHLNAKEIFQLHSLKNSKIYYNMISLTKNSDSSLSLNKIWAYYTNLVSPMSIPRISIKLTLNEFFFNHKYFQNH